MIQARVIPCLLLHRGGLVKTVKFKNPCYIGDPINAVRIFNEKEVDELILLDIDATVEKREPQYELIEDIVSEAFMPICYGGGVSHLEQVQRLFNLGIEKVAISSSAINRPRIIADGAGKFGKQSLVVPLDIRRKGIARKAVIVTHNGKISTGLNAVDMAERMEEAGAGELIINSVDRDGLMEGYDEKIVKEISSAVNIPVVALGGAGSLKDMKDIVENSGAAAAAAGSLFVFKGIRKGVLINYPSQEELKGLFSG